MNIVRIRMTFAFALVLVMTATGLSAGAASDSDDSASAAEKEMVLDPTTGKMVTAPEYGGTLTYVFWSMAGTESTDTWSHGGLTSFLFIPPVLEKLSVGNWGIDREEYGSALRFADLVALKGALAESWDISPDGLTYTFEIRQGVNWQNKAPMNGREFDAYDVEFNYHRYYGMGDFTDAGPTAHMADWDTSIVESVTATDKWTVVMKLKEPFLFAMDLIADHHSAAMYPPEVIKEHGDAKDWRNLVGTGPYMMTDLVPGSSVTYTKNPDYWAYDEKYPENRLPYIDQLTWLVMPEEATRLAALRAGTLDFMGSGNTQIRSIDQIESLRRTNPEIVVHEIAFRSDDSFGMNINNPPFDDIRVRKAMQMALDVETISATYYKGYGSSRPQGVLADDLIGWSTPFEEWPEEVKKVYTYDPAAAEALLDEAGYPRGADGIRFKTVAIRDERSDLTFAELAASYWGGIGVDVEIQLTPTPEVGSKKREGLFEMISASQANRSNPSGSSPNYYDSTTPWNSSNVKDPNFDAMLEAWRKADTIEEAQRITRDAYMYAQERHWTIWGGESPVFRAHQPWVKGYSGETGLGWGFHDNIFARVWIDSELKKEMGF